MATMTTTAGYFLLSTTASGANTQTVTLSTQNKFVDSNIIVKFTTPEAASPSLAIADTNGAVTIGAASAGSYPLSTSLMGTLTFGTPGWSSGASASDSSVQVGTIAQSYLKVDSTTVASGYSITALPSATQTVSIAAGYEGARAVYVEPMSAGTQAVASVSATKQASAPTLTNTNSAQDGKVQVTVVPTTDVTDINKYFIAVTAEAPATSFEATDATKQVTTQGYLGSISQIALADGDINTTSNSTLFYAPLSSASVNISISQAAAAPTATSSEGTLAGKTKLTGTPATDATGIDTYYIPFDIIAEPTTITSGNITKQLTSAGYLDNVSQVSVAAGTTSTTATYYMPVASGSLMAGSGNVSSTSTNVIMTEETTLPASGYYITVTGNGSVGVGTDGYVTSSMSQTSTTDTKYIALNAASTTFNGATVTVTEGYVPSTGLQETIGAGTISTGSESLTGYETNTTAEVPNNGYLYIHAGYHPNTQIHLGTLIPDAAGVSGSAGSDKILSGYGAYDTNGNKIVGTIATYDGTYSIT